MKVFMPGAFWGGTFVAFTGLLIMSSRYYSREPASLVFAQFLLLGAMLICSGAVVYGAWALAMAHEDVVRRYLTTHL